MNVAGERIGDAAPATRRAAPKHYSLIDGLRAAAAIGVLLFHYMHFAMIGTDHERHFEYLALQPGRNWLRPLYDLGFYAVPLFWIISGFVFCSVYYDRVTSTRAFAVNRLARLYPLHLLTLLVVTALQGIALARLGHTLLYDNFDLKHFALQLGFASDWLVGTGYSFNGPIWSVSVEVVVYALFWLLLPMLRRFGGVALTAVVLISLIGNALGEVTRIPFCAFFFFLGVGLNRLYLHCLRKPWLLAGVFAVLFGAASYGIHQGDETSINIFGLPGLFGGVILLLALAEPYAAAWLRRAAEWIGDCTYGIYLWHVPLQLALMLTLLPGTNPSHIAAHGWFLPLWLLSVIAVARISFVGFERPMRERLRRWGGG